VTKVYHIPKLLNLKKNHALFRRKKTVFGNGEVTKNLCAGFGVGHMRDTKTKGGGGGLPTTPTYVICLYIYI
jgi:hypothetical protein